MPANVVKKGQEGNWEKAKAIVKKNYPKVHGKRFWKLTMGIFKNMNKKSKPTTSIEMAVR